MFKIATSFQMASISGNTFQINLLVEEPSSLWCPPEDSAKHARKGCVIQLACFLEYALCQPEEGIDTPETNHQVAFSGHTSNFSKDN